MTHALIAVPDAALDAATPIHVLRPAGLEAYCRAAPPFVTGFCALSEFSAKLGQVMIVPGLDGAIHHVMVGAGETGGEQALRAAAGKIAAGDYRIEHAPDGFDHGRAALAFAQGAYRFDRYKTPKPGPRLVTGEGFEAVAAVAHALALCRDMVNTPANDMGPLQIETIAREIAQQHGAVLTVTVGDALLDAGYPAVHAVGRAAVEARAPRMIEMTWGDAAHPVVAIVGKGVVFDTGGLDIKASAGMRLMKKDMGGAAHALALARMVMDAGLPVRLAVLIPAVENAIAGDAMRPGDVLATRAGLTVEVGNTDAEGRLILADALARAGEHAPALTIDLATLTGAARIALGPQVIPFYTADDELAAALEAAAQGEADPLWRMPLWAGYAEALDSDIADLKNDPDAWAQAGSVTAALFLQKFAPPTGAWVHFDVFAWNPKAAPGRPVGGEAQAIRALLAMLKARFA